MLLLSSRKAMPTKSTTSVSTTAVLTMATPSTPSTGFHSATTITSPSLKSTPTPTKARNIERNEIRVVFGGVGGLGSSRISRREGCQGPSLAIHVLGLALGYHIGWAWPGTIKLLGATNSWRGSNDRPIQWITAPNGTAAPSPTSISLPSPLPVLFPLVMATL